MLLHNYDTVLVNFFFALWPNVCIPYIASSRHAIGIIRMNVLRNRSAVEFKEAAVVARDSLLPPHSTRSRDRGGCGRDYQRPVYIGGAAAGGTVQVGLRRSVRSPGGGAAAAGPGTEWSAARTEYRSCLLAWCRR